MIRACAIAAQIAQLQESNDNGAAVFRGGASPVLIITFGPTGVGKSRLATDVASKMGIRQGDYVTARVDDLVEKDPEYKKKQSTF